MKSKVLILFFTGIILTGCSTGEQKPADTNAVPDTAEMDSLLSETTVTETGGYHKITAEEAKSMMEKGNVTVVDVRTQEEYDSGHVENAISLPIESIGDEHLGQLPDKDAVLLVYCRSGSRSKKASDKLVESGYLNVYDFGGIIDWTYETEVSKD